MGRPRSQFEQRQRVQWEFRGTGDPDPPRRKSGQCSRTGRSGGSPDPCQARFVKSIPSGGVFRGHVEDFPPAVGGGTVSLSLKTVQLDMNGSFGPILVGRPASSQVSDQQVQEGLCSGRGPAAPGA